MILRALAIAAAAVALSGCGILNATPDLIVTTHDNNCSSMPRAGLKEGDHLTTDQALRIAEACEARDRETAVRVKPRNLLQRATELLTP